MAAGGRNDPCLAHASTEGIAGSGRAHSGFVVRACRRRRVHLLCRHVSVPVDDAPCHEFGFDMDEDPVTRLQPRPRTARPQPCVLDQVRDHGGPAGDHHTPTGVAGLVEVVRLERDHRTPHRARHVRGGGGLEQHGTVRVQEEVHRQNRGQGILGVDDTPDRHQRQQTQTLPAIQLPETVVSVHRSLFSSVGGTDDGPLGPLLSIVIDSFQHRSAGVGGPAPFQREGREFAGGGAAGP